MQYVERTLSKTILEASQYFQSIILTGPRRIGKTTLLRNLERSTRSYTSLDGYQIREYALEDPESFIQRLSLPALIDEVQHAPHIFTYIKMAVDEVPEKTGLFWMTGSQQFSMMKNVSESLAGRVGIFSMSGVSLAEEEGRCGTPSFIPTQEVLEHRQSIAKPIRHDDIFYKIWRGSFPEMIAKKGMDWQQFYNAYVMTYAEKDARDYLMIDDLVAFRKFMRVMASRTSQMLNYRDLSKEVGVRELVIKSWVNVLEATGIIVLVYPYYKNVGKRVVKTPKVYFMDTGLCAFLTKWSNPEVLESGAMAGAFLETYVVSEIYKSYMYYGKYPPIYYYRDKDKHEVDLLIEENGYLHPIEIKKSSSVRGSGFKGFDCLKNIAMPVGHGCVLCFSESFMPFNREIDIVPIGYL